MNKTLRKVADKYGKEHQSMMAIEEMSELTKELSKEYRGIGKLYNIAEELADVQIMLEQLVYLYDIQGYVEDWKTKKIKRLEGVLKE